MEKSTGTRTAVEENGGPVQQYAEPDRGRLWPLKGWRVSVAAGIATALVVLLANVAVLAWTKSHYALESGIATVFTGSCKTSSRVILLSHLGINILSTLLLAASNNCMQVLVAPTRAEVDHAHAAGKWLDIGTHSLKNLGSISSIRTLIWGFLVLSSVPLHLLYNSVVFGSSTANIFSSLTVTNDFVNGGNWNTSQMGCFDYVPVEGPFVQQLQDNATTYARLDPETCLKAYGSGYVSTYANVLLVTNNTVSRNVLNWRPANGGTDLGSDTWVCDGLGGGSRAGCDLKALVANAADWTSPGSSVILAANESCLTYDTDQMYHIDHCLAQETPEFCSVFVSVPLLAVVVACNVIKIVCLLIALLGLHLNPLITVGDAIQSFLSRPDTTTVGFGLLDAITIDRWTKSRARQAPVQVEPWKPQTRRGSAAISRRRWLWCSIGFVLALAVSVSLLGAGLESLKTSGIDTSASGLLRLGVGKLIFEQTLGYWADSTDSSSGQQIYSSLGANVLIANLPQLIVSALYLLYNDLLTRLRLSIEWASFYLTAHPLRVSVPQGLQRSTGFLQLPLWLNVPLLAMMACLHWAISQSIFYALVLSVNYSVNDVPTDFTVDGVGWSPLGLIISIAIGAALVLLLWLVCFLSKIPGGMPVARSCSAAISAACHGPEWDEEAPQKLLAWGVVGRGVAEGTQHAAFSSGDVQPLSEGGIYT